MAVVPFGPFCGEIVHDQPCVLFRHHVPYGLRALWRPSTIVRQSVNIDRIANLSRGFHLRRLPL